MGESTECLGSFAGRVHATPGQGSVHWPGHWRYPEPSGNTVQRSDRHFPDTSFHVRIPVPDRNLPDAVVGLLRCHSRVGHSWQSAYKALFLSSTAGCQRQVGRQPQPAAAHDVTFQTGRQPQRVQPHQQRAAKQPRDHDRAADGIRYRARGPDVFQGAVRGGPGNDPDRELATAVTAFEFVPRSIYARPARLTASSLPYEVEPPTHRPDSCAWKPPYACSNPVEPTIRQRQAGIGLRFVPKFRCA